MDYKEQIKHPKWQKKRLEILERDKFTCQGCGDKEKTLHIHHLRYYKNTVIWDYENDHLVTYCDKCHRTWHQAKESILATISQPDIDLMININILLDEARKLGSDNIGKLISIISLMGSLTKV